MCEFYRQLTIFCQDGIAVQPSAIPSCCNGSSAASILLSEVSTVRVMCKQCLSSVNQSWCIPGLGLKYCDGMLPFVLEGYLLLSAISGDCTQRKGENIGMSVLNCTLEYMCTLSFHTIDVQLSIIIIISFLIKFSEVFCSMDDICRDRFLSFLLIQNFMATKLWEVFQWDNSKQT